MLRARVRTQRTLKGLLPRVYSDMSDHASLALSSKRTAWTLQLRLRCVTDLMLDQTLFRGESLRTHDTLIRFITANMFLKRT